MPTEPFCYHVYECTVCGRRMSLPEPIGCVSTPPLCCNHYMQRRSLLCTRRRKPMLVRAVPRSLD